MTRHDAAQPFSSAYELAEEIPLDRGGSAIRAVAILIVAATVLLLPTLFT